MSSWEEKWEEKIASAQAGIPRALVYLKRAEERAVSVIAGGIEDAIDESGADTELFSLMDLYDQDYSIEGLHHTAQYFAEDLQNEDTRAGHFGL